MSRTMSIIAMVAVALLFLSMPCLAFAQPQPIAVRVTPANLKGEVGDPIIVRADTDGDVVYSWPKGAFGERSKQDGKFLVLLTVKPGTWTVSCWSAREKSLEQITIIVSGGESVKSGPPKVEGKAAPSYGEATKEQVDQLAKLAEIIRGEPGHKTIADAFDVVLSSWGREPVVPTLEAEILKRLDDIAKEQKSQRKEIEALRRDVASIDARVSKLEDAPPVPTLKVTNLTFIGAEVNAQATATNNDQELRAYCKAQGIKVHVLTSDITALEKYGLYTEAVRVGGSPCVILQADNGTIIRSAPLTTAGEVYKLIKGVR